MIIAVKSHLLSVTHVKTFLSGIVRIDSSPAGKTVGIREVKFQIPPSNAVQCSYLLWDKREMELANKKTNITVSEQSSLFLCQKQFSASPVTAA